MASTPQTGGFNVQVMPNVQLADPRYFDPYSRISQGFGQGLDFSGKLQDIKLRRAQDERAARQLAMQEQMQGATLENIDYNKSLRPIEKTLLENRGRIWDGDTEDEIIYKDQEQQFAPIIGEDGLPVRNQATGDIEYEAVATSPTAVGIKRRQRGKDVYGKDISRMADIVNPYTMGREAMVDERANAALSITQQNADTAALRANNPRTAEYERLLAAKAAAADIGDTRTEDLIDRRIALLNTPRAGANSRDTMGAAAGFTKEQVALLEKSPAGMSAIRKLRSMDRAIERGTYYPPTPAEIAAGEFDPYGLTQEEQEAIAESSPTAVRAPRDLGSYQTPQEAETAIKASGKKPLDGDIVTIGGNKMVWRDK